MPSIGDALSSLAIINYINNNFLVKNFYYFSNDFEYFWFENKLKYFKPKNLITIKNFPDGNKLILIAKKVGFKKVEYRTIFFKQMGILILEK